MTEEMIGEEQEMMQELGQDPLVDLKQQEINLRAQDIERKSMVDEAKLNLDQQKLNQDAEIAAMRAGVNLKQSKMRKN